jgi:hypothetical protein
VNFKYLAKNMRVMGPLGDQRHRGVIVEPPEGRPRRGGMIRVEFTPAVRAGEPYTAIAHLTREADSVQLGWSDE